MTPSQEEMLNKRSFGILGKGDFGAFLEERIKESLPQAVVRSHDPFKASEFSEDEVFDSDIVIPAVPPLEMEHVVKKAASRMGVGKLFVDVCSVKMHTAQLLKRYASRHVHYALTHPLFGRQSFVDNSNSFSGLELAYCGGRLTPITAALLTSLLSGLGLRVVSMTPEDHDKGPSIEQLVTMYQGLVMKRAGFELNSHKLHTRSAYYYFRSMYIVRNDEELFKQIAQLNPFWPEAKRKLEAAWHEVFTESGY